MIRHKIKYIVATLLVAAASFLGTAAPVYAASGAHFGSPVIADFRGDACSGVSDLGSGGCGSNASGSIMNAVKAGINILSLVVGIAAVFVLIISGLRFITSNGDASGVATARSGIIYALAGLVIVALAQAIVHYVLGKV